MFNVITCSYLNLFLTITDHLSLATRIPPERKGFEGGGLSNTNKIPKGANPLQDEH